MSSNYYSGIVHYFAVVQLITRPRIHLQAILALGHLLTVYWNHHVTRP